MADWSIEQINLLDTGYTLVRQKPETPEAWEALTVPWFVAWAYKPSVEDFRLLAEFLWENQDSVEVD
jgi:hypothetical protein